MILGVSLVLLGLFGMICSILGALVFEGEHLIMFCLFIMLIASICMIFIGFVTIDNTTIENQRSKCELVKANYVKIDSGFICISDDGRFVPIE